MAIRRTGTVTSTRSSTNTPEQTGNAAVPLRLRAGVTASQVEIGPLGYSAAAIASFAEYSKHKAQAAIPEHCRFQVALPTPLAPIQFYIAAENQQAIEPVYEKKLLEELDAILQAIPADELSIQWDTAVEFGILEGVFPTWLTDKKTEILNRLTRLGNTVPTEVELGYHLCYRDAGHKHFIEPTDTGHLATIANGISNGIKRPLNWIHLPVPKERDDRDFFEPLSALTLQPGTELYLGLIHDQDGRDANARRINAAQSVVGKFGVATECGFGRRSPESVPRLLQMHAELAERVWRITGREVDSIESPPSLKRFITQLRHGPQTR